MVNCAGRTRSIMGAESLRRAGIPNKVVALRNGTMGWELAGLQCEHGRPERFVPGTPRTADLALQTRARLRRGIRRARTDRPSNWRRSRPIRSRTLYVLDARDPSEYRAGHRKGSLSAPGGQLVQGTDNWVAVRGARIVVVDDTGVRARMSAAWLRQMGNKDVFVADNALGFETGSAAARPRAAGAYRSAPMTWPTREHGTAIIDLARSIDFRAGHIQHAIWGVRGRLGAVVPKLTSARRIVLTSPDGTLARFAYDEAKALTKAEVMVLDGGTAAWTRRRPSRRSPTAPIRRMTPASTSICAPTTGIQVSRRR